MKIAIFLIMPILFVDLGLGAQKTLVIIGDSITAGYGVSKNQAYPAELEKLINKTNKKIKIVNSGISGSTTASCVSRLKWQIKAKPEFLMIALGGNDGLRGFKTDATLKNLNQCIQLAQKNNMKVIVAGMKIPMNYGIEYRKQFEQVFETISKNKNLTYIPFLLEGVGGIKKYNLPDGIHPNVEGHKIIAKHVNKYIKELL